MCDLEQNKLPGSFKIRFQRIKVSGATDIEQQLRKADQRGKETAQNEFSMCMVICKEKKENELKTFK